MKIFRLCSLELHGRKARSIRNHILFKLLSSSLKFWMTAIIFFFIFPSSVYNSALKEIWRLIRGIYSSSTEFFFVLGGVLALLDLISIFSTHLLENRAPSNACCTYMQTHSYEWSHRVVFAVPHLEEIVVQKLPVLSRYATIENENTKISITVWAVLTVDLVYRQTTKLSRLFSVKHTVPGCDGSRIRCAFPTNHKWKCGSWADVEFAVTFCPRQVPRKNGERFSISYIMN